MRIADVTSVHALLRGLSELIHRDRPDHADRQQGGTEDGLAH